MHLCPGRRWGLIAGIAAYAKYVRPKIKIVGVEAEGQLV